MRFTGKTAAGSSVHRPIEAVGGLLVACDAGITHTLRRMGRTAGFTLLELMVAVAITAILATIAIPSYMTMIRSNRSASEANATLSTFMLARSEAIKRNRQVVVCKTTNGSACTTSGDWEEGALMYEDSDGDGELDSGEPIIQVTMPLSSMSTIAGNGNFVNKVSFNSLGRATANGQILVTPTAGDEKNRRSIVLTTTRNPRICYPDRTPTDCPSS